MKNGDTIGGTAEVTAMGVCPGIGSYVQYDRRLDARIGMAMLSIPSVKGVEIGNAFSNASKPGSAVHDEINFNERKGFYRTTNNAGGIEGGMSNGENITVRLAIKPIPTLGAPLDSVDIITKKKSPASKVRADVCVVPAAGVIAEAMLAVVLAGAYCEKFGSDCMADIVRNYRAYKKRIKNV
jgi:chorismate synthase